MHNALPGPDHPFALTAAELTQMVGKIREAEQVLGSGIKTIKPEETELAAFARRGIQAIRSIQPGDVLIEDVNIAILRPGKQSLGLHPRFIEEMAGKKATRAIAAGQGVQAGDWE